MDLLDCADCNRSYFKLPHKCKPGDFVLWPAPGKDKVSAHFGRQEMIGQALKLMEERGEIRIDTKGFVHLTAML
jgi:hypothetical protein